ncbi:PIN domain-containing protein [Sediminibacillus massiliensis]|uniref:PIN domain-containing protein n=1 Tax=Sediminibacillus massiliensis TaxID=1926277 RepID=UPI00098860C7|nr:PIN domain-containing protein [Sediminibacillus massiliensis]
MDGYDRCMFEPLLMNHSMVQNVVPDAGFLLEHPAVIEEIERMYPVIISSIVIDELKALELLKDKLDSRAAEALMLIDKIRCKKQDPIPERFLKEHKLGGSNKELLIASCFKARNPFGIMPEGTILLSTDEETRSLAKTHGITVLDADLRLANRMKAKRLMNKGAGSPLRRKLPEAEPGRPFETGLAGKRNRGSSVIRHVRNIFSRKDKQVSE